MEVAYDLTECGYLIMYNADISNNECIVRFSYLERYDTSDKTINNVRNYLYTRLKDSSIVEVGKDVHLTIKLDTLQDYIESTRYLSPT